MQLSFPLSVFLIPYLIILLVIVFLVFFTVRNLSRYRTEDVFSFIALFIFIVGIIIISYVSYNYLSPINWKEPIDIGFQFGRGSF